MEQLFSDINRDSVSKRLLIGRKSTISLFTNNDFTPQPNSIEAEAVSAGHQHITVRHLLTETEDNEENENILTELSVLKSLQHQHKYQDWQSFHGAYTTSNKHGDNKVVIVSTDDCDSNRGTLRDNYSFIAKEFDWQKKVQILKSIAVALSHLHNLKLVHGNVDANSISFNSDWEPKLCDFRQVHHRRSKTKPRKMKCDIFSFGIIIFSLLIGEDLFSHKDVNDILIEDDAAAATTALRINEKRLATIVPVNSPEDLEVLALQCCDSSESARPSIDQCINELEDVVFQSDDEEGEFVNSFGNSDESSDEGDFKGINDSTDIRDKENAKTASEDVGVDVNIEKDIEVDITESFERKDFYAEQNVNLSNDDKRTSIGVIHAEQHTLTTEESPNSFTDKRYGK